jgi:hypothetical protein
MMYDRSTVLATMCAHYRQVLAGDVADVDAAAHLGELAAIARTWADHTAADVLEELAAALQANERPTVVVPELGLQVAADPGATLTSFANADPVQVIAEADARAARAQSLKG